MPFSYFEQGAKAACLELGTLANLGHKTCKELTVGTLGRLDVAAMHGGDGV